MQLAFAKQGAKEQGESDGQLKLGGLFLRASDKNYVLMRVDAEGEHPYSVWPRSASDRAMGTSQISACGSVFWGLFECSNSSQVI